MTRTRHLERLLAVSGLAYLLCGGCGAGAVVHASSVDVPAYCATFDAQTRAGIWDDPATRSRARELGDPELEIRTSTTLSVAPFTSIGGAPGFDLLAFDLVMRRPDAAARFERIYASAESIEGQLAALCGLALTDAPGWRSRAEALASSGRLVRTIGGCIIEDVPIAELMAGRADLPRAREPHLAHRLDNPRAGQRHEHPRVP